MKRWFIKNELRVSDGDLLLDRSKIDLFRGNKIDLSPIYQGSILFSLGSVKKNLILCIILSMLSKSQTVAT